MLAAPQMEHASIRRKSAAFNANDERFRVTGSALTFSHQYAHIYYQRLITLRPILKEHPTVRNAWPTTYPGLRVVERVLDIQAGELSCLFGTVYMDMAGKPSILKEIANEVTPRSRIT